jgi:LPS export ABC transporter protein LptC
MRRRRFDHARKRVLESVGARSRGALRRAAALAAVAGLAAWAGCSSKLSSESRGAERRVPDQEARDFTLTESSEGKKNWTLLASYAAMYTDRHLIDAQTVRIEFFDSKGAKFSTLLADQGLVDQRTNNLEARGHVRIATESGIRMETDSLRWLNDRGKIVSDAFVRVTRKHDVVTGWGFESDPSLDHFQLSRQVQAEVRDAAEGAAGDTTRP